MKRLLSIFLGFISFLFTAQAKEPVTEFVRDSLHIYRRQLTHHENHRLIPEYKIQSLIALNYYPDLNGVAIQFKKKNIKTTMAAVPSWDFIFRSKENRTYRIFVNTTVKKGKGVLPEEVPLNAQIGLIGHELGHLVDFENKTAAGILLTGAAYLLPPFRKKLERKVDEITVARGLGHQLKDFSDFVLNESDASGKYKKYKQRYYYKPVQLTRVMSGYSFY
ncbi:hypothetical protein [Gaoshiqia sp. Z1-71]|uniref:hypothetical protein n=1 Tax=Gaoshiqia hydrogeniformans TaxID=3290090 RepID=UPI003BF8890B